MVRCEGWTQEREVVTKCIEMLVGELCTATDDRKVALILEQACCNGRVGRAVEKMWQSKFLQNSEHLPCTYCHHTLCYVHAYIRTYMCTYIRT